MDGDSRPEAADVDLLCGTSHLGVLELEVSCMTGAIPSELRFSFSCQFSISCLLV